LGAGHVVTHHKAVASCLAIGATRRDLALRAREQTQQRRSPLCLGLWMVWSGELWQGFSECWGREAERSDADVGAENALKCLRSAVVLVRKFGTSDKAKKLEEVNDGKDVWKCALRDMALDARYRAL